MKCERFLNIGIFTDVYKPVVNGVVTSIENLYKTLLVLNHKIYIFAPEYSGYRDDDENIYRFKSVSLSSRVNYPLGIPYSRKIFKTINSLNLDIIHCHHPFLIGRVGQYFARKLKIPLVATLHTQYEEYVHYVPFNKYLVQKIALLALKDFSNKCDLLIIPAESRKKQLRNYGISSSIKVIPNSIELKKFSNLNGKKVRDKYCISPEENLLLFVGRIAREKNIDFLLDCFKEVCKEYSNVKLLLVGDGPESYRLGHMVKQSDFAQRIIFTGEIPYKDIGDYYGAADLFVSTSMTEVHPVVLLEAMASGLPVVAVKSVGYSDTIRHEIDGLLCDENVKEFSKSVLFLLNDISARKLMGQRAEERVKDFSLDIITEEIIEAYLSLLKFKN
jgi:1,2-diacylglycerol 3-alpha-glucosyltransferase